MRVLFGLAPVSILAVSLWADSYQRQPGIDVEHYVFRVTLSDDSDAIAGEATAAIRFLDDGIREFWLDLASAAGGKGMTVSAVNSNGRAVHFTHQSDRLQIACDPPAQKGELREFTAQYQGAPATGLHFAKNRYGDRVFFSSNWPDLAHQWLPTIDHPHDKASSEFIVTAPARYQVVSNGVLMEEMDLGDGRRTTHWRQSAPIATWLNDIGVAQFASRHYGWASGVPLESWLFPQDRDQGIATFEEPLRQSIEFLASRIGPYPYEKLASVEGAAVGSGGMEVASAIFFDERTVTGRPALGLVSHEVAHQWFGDSVTEKDWDDVWLSEGFATYFAALATEHYEGHDQFVASLKRSRERVLAVEGRMPGVAVVASQPWKGIPNQIVYQKGAWVLHVLRNQIGAERFWQGIREYYRRYRDANASTADFEKVMEEAAGADLKWFFQQWLYRAGSPVVEGSWRYDVPARKIEIHLAQTQPGEPYRLPLEVGISARGAGPTRVESIVLSGKEQTYSFAAEEEPAAVELDPKTAMLMDARFTRQ
jgi:aminopeptidase N